MMNKIEPIHCWLAAPSIIVPPANVILDSVWSDYIRQALLDLFVLTKPGDSVKMLISLRITLKATMKSLSTYAHHRGYPTFSDLAETGGERES